MKKIIGSALALAFATTVIAADIPADFSAANRLYAQGKFSEAARAYDALLQSGACSAALLFNAGNAEFKAGHLGRSIAAYRRAEQIAPRDPELRANLAFVRNQVQGVNRSGSRWQNWVGTLTLNEGATLAATFFWIALALLIARQIRPALVMRLKTVTRVFGGLALVSSLVLAGQAAAHFSTASAICVADNVAARTGPFEDAQSIFTARDGAELSILGRREGWVQVADATGKIGWLSAKQVEVIPGA